MDHIDTLDGADAPDYDGEPEPLDGDTAEALSRADWHLRHLAQVQAAQQRATDIYQTEFARLDRWYKAQTQRHTKQALWHEVPLKGLHAAILAANPKRKTIELPHGTLTSTTPRKPKREIIDMAAVLRWALGYHPDLFAEPTSIGVTALETVTDLEQDKYGEWHVVDLRDGTRIPGMAASVPPPRFNIDTAPGSEF